MNPINAVASNQSLDSINQKNNNDYVVPFTFYEGVNITSSKLNLEDSIHVIHTQTPKIFAKFNDKVKNRNSIKGEVLPTHPEAKHPYPGAIPTSKITKYSLIGKLWRKVFQGRKYKKEIKKYENEMAEWVKKMNEHIDEVPKLLSKDYCFRAYEKLLHRDNLSAINLSNISLQKDSNNKLSLAIKTIAEFNMGHIQNAQNGIKELKILRPVSSSKQLSVIEKVADVVIESTSLEKSSPEIDFFDFLTLEFGKLFSEQKNADSFKNFLKSNVFFSWVAEGLVNNCMILKEDLKILESCKTKQELKNLICKYSRPQIFEKNEKLQREFGRNCMKIQLGLSMFCIDSNIKFQRDDFKQYFFNNSFELNPKFQAFEPEFIDESIPTGPSIVESLKEVVEFIKEVLPVILEAIKIYKDAQKELANEPQEANNSEA